MFGVVTHEVVAHLHPTRGPGERASAGLVITERGRSAHNERHRIFGVELEPKASVATFHESDVEQLWPRLRLRRDSACRTKSHRAG